MAYGINVNNAFEQTMFSTDWRSMVLGGSTKHSGSRKVSISTTAVYPSYTNYSGQGGYVDFRIEDTSIASNLTDGDDTMLTEPILPFFRSPVPITCASVHKIARHGMSTGYAVTSGFVANAGNNQSTMRVFCINGPITNPNITRSDFMSGSIWRTSNLMASSSESYDFSEAGTTAMAKRNKMMCQLFIGDQFQFCGSSNGTNTPPNYERIHYQGSGNTYTITAVTPVAGQTSYFDVTFTPAIGALPAFSNASPMLAVRTNLNKVFVRAYLQIQLNNTASPITASDFDMYYFRRIRNSDVGSGYGINTFDASGNLTYTSNARPFELAALGVTTKFDSTSIVDPKTGDWSTQQYMFGTTPTNFAIHSQLMGYCIVDYNSALTKGTGSLTARNNSYATPGWSAAIGLGARTTAGATGFTICKATPHIFAYSSYPSYIANELHVFPNSYVMLIDTDKYQP